MAVTNTTITIKLKSGAIITLNSFEDLVELDEEITRVRDILKEPIHLDSGGYYIPNVTWATSNPDYGTLSANTIATSSIKARE